MTEQAGFNRADQSGQRDYRAERPSPFHLEVSP
jgi:hypothetical protein